MAFYPLGLLLITFDDKISQGFVDRLVASICGSLSLFWLNQNIFCSCPFALDVGYLFALCLCFSTIIYSPGILLLTLYKGIEMLRGQESVKEEYWKVLSTGEHLKVLLLVVVYLLFFLFLFYPLLLLFKFLQLLWVIIHLLGFYIMPERMKCGNDLAYLINALYPGLATLSQNTRNDQYFLH